MGCKKPRRRVSRKTTIESLEDRQMFSADPLGGTLGGAIEHHDFTEPPLELHSEPLLEHHGFDEVLLEHHDFDEPSLVHHVEQPPDFWYDAEFEPDPGGLIGDIEQTLASAHGLTGVTQARTNYGFLGTGQTVAIIDSGIAWDHAALGGGFGANYRVVGGWDFTDENDANPFDDGPAGSHGTHVAGIVGAAAANSSDSGVAPGVDLVGLRVFNDTGAGYFSWVENALRWVHTNRNAFENPITAVNLSLGTTWNSDTIPAWATLEDEFAQLEADGIFIAVSAGNAFASYNAPGLSYPAASPYVVPVMSVDDNGSLSYYSQRHERAIAAPGRTIRSTVPDYIGNQNGVTDDWANKSGTSMAAPYVAGASVIVREAMQFVGYTNITQDMIFNHMVATSDQFFDAATNAYYNRLNVGAAIDALMPTDEYGSTAATAHSLGTVGVAGGSISGVIGRLTDADYFQFTAGVTGTVTFTADTTHSLAPVWTGTGVANGNTYTIDVVAGQTYTVGLSTSGGLGYYDLDFTAQSAFSYTDWGTIAQWGTNDLAISGETWYRVVASQAGYLTAEAMFAGGAGNVDLAWYDANMQLVASGLVTASGERVDRLVNAGDQLYLCVTGANADVDFRITNLVSLVGSTVNVTGTSESDTLTFVAGVSQHSLTVNGVAYEFSASSASTFLLHGGSRVDTFTMTGLAGNETVRLYNNQSIVQGAGYSLTATSMEDLYIFGNGGTDSAYFYDTAGDERFQAWTDRARMIGGGIARDVRNFSQAVAYATGGYDTATLYDSTGDDVFSADSGRASLAGQGFNVVAWGFDQAVAHATAGGFDRANLYDSAGNDNFNTSPDRAIMSGTTYYNIARGFERAVGYASTGNDQALFYDSLGDDTFTAMTDRAIMSGGNFHLAGWGFDRAVGYASGGYDQAFLYDSAGDDLLTAMADRTILSGSNFYSVGWNFERTVAYASSGYDRATFYDSSGDDVYNAYPDRASMEGSNYANTGWYFDRTVAYSSSGNDQANYYDSAGDDTYLGLSDRAIMYGGNYYNAAWGFNRTTAHATAGGYDRASLYGTAGDEALLAELWGASLSGNGFQNEARGFEEISVDLRGGNDSVDVDAVDYIFNLVGQAS